MSRPKIGANPTNRAYKQVTFTQRRCQKLVEHPRMFRDFNMLEAFRTNTNVDRAVRTEIVLLSYNPKQHIVSILSSLYSLPFSTECAIDFVESKDYDKYCRVYMGQKMLPSLLPIIQL
jgi:hypothetical protein